MRDQVQKTPGGWANGWGPAWAVVACLAAVSLLMTPLFSPSRRLSLPVALSLSVAAAATLVLTWRLGRAAFLQSRSSAVAHLVGMVVALSAWVFFCVDPVYLFDDSFYYMKIAKNIVELGWSTFDGVVTTNGYHPLWMAVIVPLAALAHCVAPHRAIVLCWLVYACQIGLLAATMAAVYTHLRAVASSRAAVLMALAFLAFPFCRENMMNGMETPLTVAMLLWSNHWFVADDRCSRHRFWLSVFLLPLARIEVGVCWGGWMSLQLGLAAARNRLPFRQYLRRAFPIAFFCGLGLSASFLFNWLLAGDVASFAGRLKQGWALREFQAFLRADSVTRVRSLIQMPFSQTALEYPALAVFRVFRPGAAWLAWCASVGGGIAALLLLLGGTWRGLLRGLRATRLGAFVLFAVALSAMYKVLLFTRFAELLGGHEFQGHWYHQPLDTAFYLVWILGLHAWTSAREERRRFAPPLAVLAAIGVIATQSVAVFSENNRALWGNPSTDAVLGALESGERISLVWHPNGGRDGYFLHARGVGVLNGDGLVNSPRYMARISRDGEVAPYLREVGCHYFIAPVDAPCARHPLTHIPVVRDSSHAELVQIGYWHGRVGAGGVGLWRLRDNAVDAANREE